MIFGTIPLKEAEGALLAHAVRTRTGLFEKGRHLSAADIAVLTAEGRDAVVAVRLEPGDVAEDEAAMCIARSLAGSGLDTRPPFTGRANIHAKAAGLLRVDAARVDRLNALDEGLTIATLPDYAPLAPGQMAVTVKIIPFALPEKVIAAALALLGEGAPALSVAPFRPQRVALIVTRLAGTKGSVIDKTRLVTRARIEALGASLVFEEERPHEVPAIAASLARAGDAGAQIILIAGASATGDRNDIVPAALRAAGGEIRHFGMPVDPGNLLLLGAIGPRTVVGLPGCARSPKLNGVDWVLQRLAAELPVTSREIMAMGVGGLLTEMPARPQPRLPKSPAPAGAAPRIGAVLLAAGLSRRMGHNKLLSLYQGESLIRRAARTLIEAGLRPVVAVTGHEASRIEAALAGMEVRCVLNADYESGLSSSLKTGIAALEEEGVDAALIALADMPLVTAGQLRRLAAAYNPAEGRLICVPVHEGKQGNPVLWDASLFSEMKRLMGDKGAKSLLAAHAEEIAEIDLGDPGILFDVDTPEALAQLSKEAP